MGSIISSFRFEGYKIDRILYGTIPDVGFLEVIGTLPSEGWKFDIGIRQPLYFKSKKKYVGGMDIKITYPISEKRGAESPDKGQDEKAKIEIGDNIVKLEIGIAGAFSVEENRFEKTIEENLVKVQIPVLLFPYLRSAITSIFAHAGLGSTILPLINVQELAKSANLSITEME